MLLVLAAGPAGAASTRHRPPHPQPHLPARTLGAVDNLTATAVVLMDAKTGQVLYERNAYLAWPPASTTKIMTALVALERTSLDTRITISPAVAHFREGSTVGLPANSRIPLRDLLYALLLPSGNDVALAIAEGTAGSVPAFVALMNEKAWQLGATQTHFTSPHGLYDPEHYSTAYDLALIARVAMQNPVFREIVHTRSWVFSIPGRSSRRVFNHNRFLNRYPGADGVKTGYVHQAGLTFVASATHQGWRLIAVVLHSRDLYGDASRLLNYGFTRSPAALAASTAPTGATTPLFLSWATHQGARVQPSPAF